MLDRGLWAMVPAQRPVEVHAVGEQPCIVATPSSQAPARRVDAILGYVDVDAHPEIGRQPGDRLEARLGEREAGVRTDKSPSPRTEEALVLGQAGAGARPGRGGR